MPTLGRKAMKWWSPLTVLVAAAVLGTACASASGRPRASRATCPATAGRRTAAPAGAATDVPLLLVDPRRATPRIPGRPATTCRILPTVVRLPASPAPRPLLVV